MWSASTETPAVLTRSLRFRNPLILDVHLLQIKKNYKKNTKRKTNVIHYIARNNLLYISLHAVRNGASVAARTWHLRTGVRQGFWQTKIFWTFFSFFLNTYFKLKNNHFVQRRRPPDRLYGLAVLQNYS
jgi:hypothetical protein